MKRIVFLAALLALASAPAQEKLSREECLKYAFLVSSNLKELLGTPIPTDPDLKRPAGIQDENCGAMVLPETKLSAQTLAGAGKTVVPVGQLWMAKLVPTSEGKALATDKLRLVHLTVNNNDLDVPCFALGVRQGPKDSLELLLYGKSAEPLMSMPLKAISTSQDVPIDMTATRKDSGAGTLTLRFFGKYEATLNLELVD
jgi:hypothetical protein